MILWGLDTMSSLTDLNERARLIFKEIVDGYLTTGDPVGSRTISRIDRIGLSAATVRNVMADLEEAGLIEAPHTSAGRIPTDIGLRFFVDGMMQRGEVSGEDRALIKSQCAAGGLSSDEKLAEATKILSGLSQCASVVMVPKQNMTVKHIEFVPLSPQQALVVLVGEDGRVENRLLPLPPGLPPSALVQAGNYLSARLAGGSVEELTSAIQLELNSHKAELDKLTSDLVARGLAIWSGDDKSDESSSLIVSGTANLLDQNTVAHDFDRVKHLFDELERKREVIRLLDMARDANGVRLFIGAENNLFSLSGSSLIAAPYMNAAHDIVGVIGVIGPTRLNYARIIPLVDYTAQVVSRLL